MNKILFFNNYRASYVIPELLVRANFTVVPAEGDEAGLQSLGSDNFDIIIAMEPPTGGSAVTCARIRERTDLPLIVISPEASTENCVKAINAGADYFMRKPFGPLEFIARINSLLQRTSARQPANVAYR